MSRRITSVKLYFCGELEKQVYLIYWELPSNFSNLNTVFVTEPQAAPLTCRVLSVQQGQMCVCNYMYHEVEMARQALRGACLEYSGASE